MKSLLIFACLLFALPVQADQFRVTTLRASPGQLEALIGDVQEYQAGKSGNVVIMRHSQGDHWDLLLLEPAGLVPTRMADFGHLADFQHTFLALSDASFNDVKTLAAENSLYHIEMFHALAGKKQDLINQRRMENRYLHDTGQITNLIFGTLIASDVDVFTIGFHPDLEAFAKDPGVDAETAERVAKDAGFKNRADIGFYLRRLLTRHHDTLAVPVR